MTIILFKTQYVNTPYFYLVWYFLYMFEDYLLKVNAEESKKEPQTLYTNF